MRKNWEKETLVRIKREFSEKEKYKLLTDNYNQMEAKLLIYKEQLTKMSEKYSDLKKKYADLQSKYTKLNKS